MRIRIIASDSMGVRSIATVVEACGLVIGIDLGAALGPRRYGLPPHPLELKRLDESIDRALRWLRESHVVIITHYHYDHYMRDYPEEYYGKILLVKHPTRDINRSQAIRSYKFLKKGGVEDNARVEYADSRTFNIEGVRISLSEPSWHGEPGTRLGKVIMARIECEGRVFIYGSDIQGPMDEKTLATLESWSRMPGEYTILVDGPPTYFAGYKVSHEAVNTGLSNMLEIIRRIRPNTLIIDHHLVRDINYRSRIEEHITEASRAGVRLVNAAQFMGVREEPLEALRKILWEGE